MTDAADPFPYAYPPIEADAGDWLDVGSGHAIWWETSGRPDGAPVLFVHGGPGAPPTSQHRRFYDPDTCRLVVVHQRGCGRSRPLAATEGNDTAALIADFERVRALLGIERWLVTGGSWGSCLALAYAQAHPARVLGFTLIAITLNRPADLDWWWTGTRRLFPDAWERLMAGLPPKDRETPMAGFYRLVMSPDPAVHLPAARAICLFSAATVNVTPNAATLASYDDPDIVLPLARLFLHYNRHRAFLRPNQLLENLPRIAHLPAALIGGRYDVTTPLQSAWDLHRAWPGSTLEIVPDGAHGLRDPALGRAFLRANDEMRARL